MAKPLLFKITDYVERDLRYEEEECRALGLRLEAFQLKTASPAELVAAFADADILLVNMARITREVIAGLRRTKLLLRHGIGYDNVDVAAATRRGIVFANEATASSEDVAEHAAMLILEIFKKKNIQDIILKDWIRTGVWSSEKIAPLYRLTGKTLGIVGCGNIGRRLLGKMRGFGMRILVCDPYLPAEKLRALGVVHTPFAEILRESDILSIHAPVSPETRGMFNASAFAAMKPSAFLVNTARGPIIRTLDLVAALKKGVIAGAALDVFEDEPPSPKIELRRMNNVILSPHIAWYSEEGGWDIRHMIMEDVRAFLDGRLPRFVINREVLQKSNLRYPLKK